MTDCSLPKRLLKQFLQLDLTLRNNFEFTNTKNFGIKKKLNCRLATALENQAETDFAADFRIHVERLWYHRKQKASSIPILIGLALIATMWSIHNRSFPDIKDKTPDSSPLENIHLAKDLVTVIQYNTTSTILFNASIVHLMSSINVFSGFI